MSETKTVKVSEETHQDLTDLGSKGESYDAIIRRLIEKWEATELTDEQIDAAIRLRELVDTKVREARVEG